MLIVTSQKNVFLFSLNHESSYTTLRNVHTKIERLAEQILYADF